ncbi:MAG: hypothetical protein F4147_05535 [Gammaproteobacteria bacterium]|nr:hypothetical protein [Gammaproteobacteria bacterium]
MSKAGRLTTDKWGAYAPVHSPAAQRNPLYFRNTETVTITWRTDEDAILDILPPVLSLHEPATAFMVLENNHWSTVGPYREVFAGILCEWEGNVYSYLAGVYCTSETSQIVDRELYGFGKKQAHRIEVVTHSDGHVEAVMDVKPDDRAVRAMMRPEKHGALEDGPAPPLINLRVIADVEGGDLPILAQLVTLNYQSNPVVGSDGKVEIFNGPGNLQFGAPSDCALPIKELIAFEYGRANAELDYGKVEKTFTAEELQAMGELRGHNTLTS